MSGVAIIIVVNIVAVAAYWIYSTLVQANEKEKKFGELIKNASERVSDYKVKELLFSQFKEYVSALFNEREQLKGEDLRYRLKLDYPLYKGGHDDELFHDLRRAGLIKHSQTAEYFEIGKSFRDLKLLYPDLILFLTERCNRTEMFRHNMHLKESVWEAEIEKSLRSDNPGKLKYFAFGVCSGSVLREKINLQDHVESESHYLYSKVFEKVSRGSKAEITDSNFKLLNQGEDYSQLLRDWLFLSLSKDI